MANWTYLKIYLIVLFFNCSKPELVLPQIMSWNHISLREENGLPSNFVLDIEQDHRGFIWLVTSVGLCRYDGSEFVPFFHDPDDFSSLPTDHVTDLLLLPNDSMLCSTLYGIYIFNTSTFKGRRIQISSTLKDWHYRDNYTDKLIYIPELSKIVVKSSSSIIYFDIHLQHADIIRFPYKSNDIEKAFNISHYQPILDSKFNIIINSNDRNLFYIADLEKKKMFPLSECKEHEFYSLSNYKKIDNFTKDSLGYLWFHICDVDSLFCIRPFKKPIAYPIPKSLSQVGWVGQIQFPNKNKMIWMCYSNGINQIYELPYQELLRKPGMTIYGKEFSNIDACQYNIYEDKDQNSWIIHNRGLEFIKNNYHALQKIKLQLRFPQDPSIGHLKSLYALNKDSILITANGERVFIYEKEKNKMFKLSDPFVPDLTTVWSSRLDMIIPLNEGRILLRGDNDNILQNFVLKCGFKAASKNEKILVNNESRVSYVDKNNNTWVAQKTHGLLRFNIKYGHDTIFMADSKFLFANISSISEDDNGNIWFSNNRNSELYKYNYNSSQFSKILVPKKSLLGIVNLIYTENDNLFLTDHSSLTSYNIKTKKLQSYSMKDGLPSRDIEQLIYAPPFLLATSKSGCFFLNTHTGLHFVLKSNEGIVNNITTCGLYDTSNDIVYLGGEGCLYKIDLHNFSKYSPAPMIYIEDIKAGSQFYKTLSENISLPANENSISFHAVSVDYQSAKDKSFWYQLVYNNDSSAWIQNRGPDFTFNNLASGKYTILLKSKDRNNQWSNNTVFLAVTIATAWNNSWWFYFIIISLPIGMIVYYYYSKLKEYKKIIAIRSQLSRDLHDDLGSTISSINILSRTKGLEFRSLESQKITLNKIHEKSQKMLSNLKDIVWNINPDTSTLHDLIIAMREFATNILDPTNIQYTLSFPDNSKNFKLPLKLKSNLFLIFKEALNNLSKYSQCTKANISMEIVQNNIILEVRDNGIGFDKNKLKHIGGLENMMVRAAEIEGSLQINSTPNKGTTIILLIKQSKSLFFISYS